LEKLLPLDLENFLKMTVSVHFLSDGFMDSNYIWYTDVSWRDAGILIFIFFFLRGGDCIFIHLQLPQNCWNDFNESW
jgi:hypothetical protein